MSEAMWFVLGAVCGGVAVGLCLVRKKRPSDVEKSEPMAQRPTKEWVHTRNFLYYDGTEMPVVKENVNE